MLDKPFENKVLGGKDTETKKEQVKKGPKVPDRVTRKKRASKKPAAEKPLITLG